MANLPLCRTLECICNFLARSILFRSSVKYLKITSSHLNRGRGWAHLLLSILSSLQTHCCCRKQTFLVKENPAELHVAQGSSQCLCAPRLGLGSSPAARSRFSELGSQTDLSSNPTPLYDLGKLLKQPGSSLTTYTWG